MSIRTSSGLAILTPVGEEYLHALVEGERVDLLDGVLGYGKFEVRVHIVSEAVLIALVRVTLSFERD